MLDVNPHLSVCRGTAGTASPKSLRLNDIPPEISGYARIMRFVHTSGLSWPARCAGRPQLAFDPEMPIRRQIIFTRAHNRGTGPGRSSSFQPLPGRGYFLSFICSLRCILSRRSRMPCPTSENQIAIDQSQFWDSNGIHWSAHRIGWAIAGGCAAIVSTFSVLGLIYSD